MVLFLTVVKVSTTSLVIRAALVFVDIDEFSQNLRVPRVTSDGSE